MLIVSRTPLIKEKLRVTYKPLGRFINEKRCLKTMGVFKIKLDQGCIGCGACESACPENWKMKGELAEFKKDTISEEELPKNKEAAQVCPVMIIHIEDENGKQIM